MSTAAVTPAEFYTPNSDFVAYVTTAGKLVVREDSTGMVVMVTDTVKMEISGALDKAYNHIDNALYAR